MISLCSLCWYSLCSCINGRPVQIQWNMNPSPFCLQCLVLEGLSSCVGDDGGKLVLCNIGSGARIYNGMVTTNQGSGGVGERPLFWV